ncbi:hypothetical protein LZ30DRAFT_690998 [Colletotrichum cereale]|nr:hypothetical protein LZ30DRAFT_690998 [Colletotrichum cereale]
MIAEASLSAEQSKPKDLEIAEKQPSRPGGADNGHKPDQVKHLDETEIFFQKREFLMFRCARFSKMKRNRRNWVASSTAFIASWGTILTCTDASHNFGGSSLIRDWL